MQSAISGFEKRMNGINCVHLQTVNKLVTINYLIVCDVSDLWTVLQEMSVKDIKKLIAILKLSNISSSKYVYLWNSWFRRDMSSKSAILQFIKSILFQTSFTQQSNETRFYQALLDNFETPFKLHSKIRAVLTTVKSLYYPNSEYFHDIFFISRSSISSTLSELGKIRLPLYCLFPSFPVFSTRQQFDL